MNRPDLIGAWDGLIACMQHIRDSGNEWPSVRVEIGPEGFALPVRFKLSADGNTVFVDEVGNGRRALCLLKLGRAPYWQAGIKELGAPYKDAVWQLLLGLGRKPREELARRGRELGWCCLCGRPLSDPESVAAGMGPVCRQRLGG